MRIQSIIREKGSFVATIGPGETATEASTSLNQHNVGALVVVDESGGLIGIISERDIARAVAAHGGRTVGMLVSELMTSEVQVCSSHDTVDHLMAIMTELRARHIPVVEDGRLVGIVSIGDLVKHRLGELEEENSTLHHYIEAGR